jgi:hypothetical protein
MDEWSEPDEIQSSGARELLDVLRDFHRPSAWTQATDGSTRLFDLAFTFQAEPAKKPGYLWQER